MNKVYLICYSTEEGTYTSHIAFATPDVFDWVNLNDTVPDAPPVLKWYEDDVEVIVLSPIGLLAISNTSLACVSFAPEVSIHFFTFIIQNEFNQID